MAVQSRNFQTQTSRLGLRDALRPEPAETLERILLNAFWVRLDDEGLERTSVASVVSITSRSVPTKTSSAQVLPEGGS